MLLATRCSLASPRVRATALDAASFPGRADRLGVLRVPAVVVDGTLRWSGAAPEAAFVERLVGAAGGFAGRA